MKMTSSLLNDPAFSTTNVVDIEVQKVLLAAAHHDTQQLKQLLRTTSATAQDPDTGYSALHTAIAAYAPEDTNVCETVGASDEGSEPRLQKAKETLQLLFDNGAIWNDLDKNDETPGCLALRLGLKDLYAVVVEAGVRAEVLLNRLEEVGYDQLTDEEYDEDWEPMDEEEEEEDDEENDEANEGEQSNDEEGNEEDDDVEATPEPERPLDAIEIRLIKQREAEEEAIRRHAISPSPAPEQAGATSTSLAAIAGLSSSNSATTIQTPQQPQPPSDHSAAPPSSSTANYIDTSNPNTQYLHEPLTFTPRHLLDSQQNPVMMSWETRIMQRTAAKLLPSPGLSILNIGHGMGIFDDAVRALGPAKHHIVEAHPDVLARLNGPAAGSSAAGAPSWRSEAGVEVHSGRWQDVLPTLMATGEMYDAISFDTYAESYRDFKMLFEDCIIALLAEGGRWSFFHGLGADRQVCYDVYTRVVEMDLCDAGFDVDWEDERVKEDVDGEGGDAGVESKGLGASEVWKGTSRRYWNIDVYRLPICTFLE